MPEALDDRSDVVEAAADKRPWYADVTRYQWLVLVIASAGWVFDAFEGQVFNITRDDLLRDLLGPGHASEQKFWATSSWQSFCSAGR